MIEKDRPAFPNFAGKHEHDAMFSPRDLIEHAIGASMMEELNIPESVILCYSPNLLRYVEALEGVETVGFIEWGGTLYRLPPPNENVGVVGDFGIGAPAAAARVEELIAAGTTKFLNIGWAGSLQRDCMIGDVVVCTRAVRDEGVSHHYLAADKHSVPSQVLRSSLKRALDKAGVRYVEGATWTIDAPYRETVEEARHYQGEGVLTVEMEAAGVFAVGAYRGVEVAAAFVISDSLAELVWDPKFGGEEVNAGMRALFDAAVEAFTLS